MSVLHILTQREQGTGSGNPLLEGPEKFSHPESHSKISNVMITELFDSMIFWHEHRFSSYKVSGPYISLFLRYR